MENDVRLIDANALDLRNRVATDMGGMCFIEDVETAIEQASTIDAVPVVRCKDCRLCLYDLTERENHLCMRMKNGFPLRQQVKADDFCSFGERKADAR